MQVKCPGNALLIKRSHMKHEYIDHLGLPLAVAPSHRLILNGRVPVWSHEVGLRKLLQIKTLTPGLNLQDYNIDVFAVQGGSAIPGGDPAVERCNLQTGVREPAYQLINLLTIVAEYEFLSLPGSADDSRHYCVHLATTAHLDIVWNPCVQYPGSPQGRDRLFEQCAIDTTLTSLLEDSEMMWWGRLPRLPARQNATKLK